MRKLLIGTLIGLVIGLSTGIAISGHSQPKTATVAPSEPTIAQLLTLVNAERAKNGVAPLKEDVRLDASAQMKANDEVAYNYFGHVSPDSSPHAGKTSHDYIFDTGISCVDSSENLTENTHVNDAQHAVDAWIASPAHHAAMIDGKYTLTGFGIDHDQIVEHFCEQ